MKIDEKIQEMQSKLRDILINAGPQNDEEIIHQLERFGLDNEHATKLVEAFRKTENARKAIKNVWDSTLESRVGSDNGISEYQQHEDEAREQFDSINSDCAILAVTKRIEPNQIDDETLSILYNQNINEQQIANQALRIAFHYYRECQLRESQKNRDRAKVKSIFGGMHSQMIALKTENEALKSENEALKAEKDKIIVEHATEVVLFEKYYQGARTIIKRQERELQKEQKMNVFQKIFGTKRKQLQLSETSIVIPDTLYETSTKKMRIENKVIETSSSDRDQKRPEEGTRATTIEDEQK